MGNRTLKNSRGISLIGAMLLAATLHGCATQSTPSDTDYAKQYEAEWAKQSEAEFAEWRKTGTPFLGMALRDEAPPGNTGGTLIGWVAPGPLRKNGEKSALVSRGDVLLTVDGKPMKATDLRPYVRSKRPGDVIELKVRRTGGSADAAVPTPGPENKEVTLKVTLGAREEWCGPAEFADAQPRAMMTTPQFEKEAGATHSPPPLFESVFGNSGFVDRRVTESNLREPVDRLYSLLKTTSVETAGHNIHPFVRSAFADPKKLPGVASTITSAFTRAAADPRRAIPWAWAMMGIEEKDAASLTPGAPRDLTQPAAALDTLAADCADAEKKLGTALPLNHTDKAADYFRLRRDLLQLLKISKGAGGIDDDEDPRPAIAAMRKSMTVDFTSLYAAAQGLARYMPKAAGPAKDAKIAPLPPALKDAVTGDILAAVQSNGPNGQWFVYGGPSPNTYDMSVVTAVIDAGGDDVYRYPDKILPQVQLIIDLAGNDQYLGEAIGPAAGFMGVSLIIDHAGNDTYRGKDLACGTGFMGVGVIVDHDGEDTYAGESWSQGAGFYGFGAVIDLGNRRDEYRAKTYSQGIGGPKGVGLILDQGGNDFYFTDGPETSAYGEPNVRFSMSQGMGFGVRGYDSGGIGVLLDLSGNDRYIAGEFCQGGGYYWGLGILHDSAGDDVYYSNRYSQGFGCHQALGVLDDESGDDTYWATVAASQGAAWDIAMGVLIDRAGHDSYRSDGLSQGAAAMQGIGWLIDFAGVDHYRSTSPNTQGQSSGNAYHYASSKCFSFSLLLDADGDRDFYSTGRPNGKTMTTGEKNEAKPEDSGLHGLFISVPGKVDWAK